jgi:predicted GNAT family acetyltransferase
MLRWADRFGIAVPDALLRLQWRMEQRPLVRTALAREEAALPRKVSPSRIDTSVRENPSQHRFERQIHDGAIAAAYFRNADGKLVFIHTEVPSEFSGLGIATELARGTFELLRKSGRKAVLKCPFMVHFASTHPEYADVVDG